MNSQRPPTREDLVHCLGPLDDRKVREILGLAPSWEDIEIAASYLAGGGNVMGKERKQLSGRAAAVHEIATREDTYGQDR